MRYYVSEHFKKQLKKYSKKYRNLKDDLIDRLELFDAKIEIQISNSVYKIRVRSSDINKGKSGGFRAYIYIIRKNDLLVPICLYPKSDRENVSKSEIANHLNATLTELTLKKIL